MKPPSHTEAQHAAAHEALDAFHAALLAARDLTELQLLNAIGAHLDDQVPTPDPRWAVLLELETRFRLDELRKHAPRLRTANLVEGAVSIAEKAQQIVNALADHSMTAEEAKSALYALQVASADLRQLEPKRPPGRPKKTPPPSPRTRGGAAPVSRTTPPKEER